MVKKTISNTFVVSTVEEGADAPYIELSRSTILYKANSDGYSIASQNFAITYALKVKGNPCAIASVNDVSISLPSNVTVASGTKTTSGCTINCAHSKIMSGVITITITGTYDGVTYTATGTITVDSLREGQKGEQGEQGEDGDSIFPVQAFKYFSGTPSSSDKPTKTTNIWQSTTDFGNGWHNTPTKQADTGLSSIDYSDVAGWFANGVVTIPSPGDSGINIGTIYFTTSQADVDVEIEITSSSEANYDFGAIGKLDTTSLTGATASSIKSDNGTICSGKVSGNGSTILVTLSVASAGRHSVQIAYAKDGSASSYNDNAVVQVVTSVDENGLVYCCMATVLNGTVSGSWSSPIPWQGDTGKRGKVGRFYYYSGFDWNANDNDPSHAFVVNDAQVPYFSKAGSNANKYYVFNPETIPASGEMTMAQMWAASDQNWNNASWEVMTNDFKYLITEAIFGAYAHFGSFIINGDWMISQHGVIYDTSGGVHTIDDNNSYSGYTYQNAYTLFDPDYPNSSKPSANNFVPNYAIDGKTGNTYQQNAYVNGSVKTKSMGVEFADIRSMADDSMFVVGVDTTVGGANISGIWNFKTKYQTIFLPTNKYSNYGQRVILYNSTVGLGGANGTTIQCGEIDSQRLTTLSYLRGVGINYNSSKPYEPIPLNSYYRVESIEFLNGVVELMCVPTDAQGQLCEWVVVNIGTNIYRMTKYD